MMNYVVEVGRIKEFIKVNNDCQIKIAVQRSYKNEDGEYGFDLIPVIATGGIAEQIMKYCTEDSIIGVKGKLETSDDKVYVIAEKVTLLSTAKKEDE